VKSYVEFGLGLRGHPDLTARFNTLSWVINLFVVRQSDAALASKADMCSAQPDVRLVPIADI